MDTNRIAHLLEDLAAALRRLASDSRPLTDVEVGDEIQTEMPQGPDVDDGPHGIGPDDKEELLNIASILDALADELSPAEEPAQEPGDEGAPSGEKGENREGE